MLVECSKESLVRFSIMCKSDRAREILMTPEFFSAMLREKGKMISLEDMRFYLFYGLPIVINHMVHDYEVR